MVKPVLALVKFLAEDGHRLHDPTGKEGSQRTLDCFNKNHPDEAQSMRADLTQETYKCDVCGTSGNALSYLRRQRGLGNDQAFALLKACGWTKSRVNAADKDDKTKHVRGLQYVDSIPVKIPRRGMDKRVEHPYGDGQHLVHIRVLYAGAFGGSRVREEHITFTPASSRGGGYWICDCIDSALPADDRLVQQYPLYRTADMQRRLEESEHKGVWLVSDERICDMIRSIEDHPNGPIPATCFFDLGRTRFEDHDIGPLKGKSALVIAKQDQSDRRAMSRLGRELGKWGVNVSYCLLAGETGLSLGDAIGESGLEGAKSWFAQAHIGDDPDPPRPAPDEAAGEPGIQDNPHFTILGLVDNRIMFRVKRTHQMLPVSRSMLAHIAQLLPLAPLSWWRGLVGKSAGGNLSRDDCYAIADRINRVADKQGFFDLMASAIGRGAFTYTENDKPKVGYNLGDRILLAGKDKRLTEEASLDALDITLLPGAPIDVWRHPDAEQYGRDLVEALSAYRWLEKAHAKAYIGWIVTALIGGALRFRPMLWILANSSTGKTFLIDTLKLIMGPLSASFNDVSQAGAANTVRSDSVPSFVDEFEPEKDEDRWRRVLRLLRQATSGSGQMTRSTVDGMVRSIQLRCSLIFASTRLPTLNTTESNRIFILRFGRPVNDWPAVEDAIIEATRPTRMLALRGHIIEHTPEIIARAREIERNLLRRRSSGITTREAQILAGLTAGYGFLSGDYSLIRRVEDVKDDSYGALEALLSKRVETSWDASHSIAELLTASQDTHPQMATEGRKYGFMLLPEGDLAIAHKAEAPPTALLKNTAHANTDLSAYLHGIGAPVWRRKGGEAARLNTEGRRYVCRVVPKETLDEIGFGPEENDDDDDE